MDEKKLREQMLQIKETSVRPEIMRIYEELILQFNGYQEERLEEIRNQVRASMEKDESDYAVEMFVCETEHAKQYEECYEPLLATGIGIKTWGNGVLETVFLEADNNLIEKYTGKEHSYKALVKTNYETYPVTVTLHKNREGLQRAEDVNRLMVQNGVDLPSVNEGYLHKFYDVVFEEVKDRLRPDETVDETVLSLGKLNPFVRKERVLLWNVRQVKVKEMTFPVPLGNELKFRHELMLDDAKAGYLLSVPGENLLQKYRKGKILYVTTQERQYQMWSLYEIMDAPRRMAEGDGICLMTNRMKKSLLSDLSGQHGRHLYTWGEICRRAACYEAAELFTQITVEKEKKQHTVQMLFDPKQDGFYLNQDAAEFIIADLAADYPGCRITGRMRKSNE